ncbi:MAG: cell division protein ZapE [Gammaproteobacteria bacterium]
MTPLERYRKALNSPDFTADPAQEAAVRALDELWKRLERRQEQSDEGGGFLKKLFGKRDKARPPEKGLYLWGGVGRGKTWLMDSFFDTLPFDNKHRYHFHRFMQRVHREMHALKGTADPLNTVADKIAAEGRILCLDEMHVSDVADAAIMNRLLGGLFERGVCLVTTSNREPDELAQEYMLRRMFTEAIGLIKDHTDVLNVDGGTDYRLRTLEQASTWYHPLGDDTDRALDEAFIQSAAVAHDKPPVITINEREMETVRWTDGVVWFDFDVICGVPRARTDLIEIARYFHTALISDIPQLDDGKNDFARRFTHLIDEFYDRNVKVIVSCAVPIEHLYVGSELAFEYERTVSRLQEMQSAEYLSQPHRP